MNNARGSWALSCLTVGLVALPFALITVRGQSRTPYTTWSDYSGSADSMQYSALRQINKSNVNQLQRAWFYPVPDRIGAFSFNPIVVDGVMYVLGRKNSITALEATTGKEIWMHVPEGGGPGSRGINYWESTDRSDRRLIFGAGGTIRAIDARTGHVIKTFGDNGRVATRVGELRPLGGPAPTAGRVFENLYITGSGTGETYGSPPGDIRAFDVVTGYVRAFDKDNGKILWEHDLNANPEGLPSVFEANGRQHVAFTASYYASLDPGNISTFQGNVENQGYYVFALPK